MWSLLAWGVTPNSRNLVVCIWVSEKWPQGLLPFGLPIWNSVISAIFASFLSFLYHLCHFCIISAIFVSFLSKFLLWHPVGGYLYLGEVYKTDSLLRQSVCAMQGVSVEPSHSALWVPYFCSLHPCNSNERWGREDCTFKHLALWISIIYKWMNESNEQHPGQCIRLGCTTKLLLKTCKAAKYLSFIIFLKPMSC